jgi:hypothetical protein
VGLLQRIELAWKDLLAGNHFSKTFEQKWRTSKRLTLLTVPGQLTRKQIELKVGKLSPDCF